LIVWRISNHATLDGGGGLRAPGRWHSRGRRIVYTSACAATALLEILVNLELEPGRLPRAYQLLRIEVPDDLAVSDVGHLPDGWRDQDQLTRPLGDAWLAERAVPLLRVPSAVIDVESNILINPEHPDAARVRLIEASQKPFDPRLFR
jgi:RES domain-containing protein